MSTFTAAGDFGTSIAALTLVIVALGVVCAAIRVRRVVAASVLLAGLLPLGAGLLGSLCASQQRLLIVQSVAAPSQADFQPADDMRDACLALGIAGMFVCDLAAVAALARASRPSVSP